MMKDEQIWTFSLVVIGDHELLAMKYLSDIPIVQRVSGIYFYNPERLDKDFF